MSKKSISTQQQAEQAIQRLGDWLDTRSKNNDWSNYVGKNGLSKSDIAAECGIARSTLYTNKSLNNMIDAANANLANAGLWSLSKPTQQNQNHDGADPKDTEIQRLKKLLAEKTAENEALKRENNRIHQAVSSLAPLGGRIFPGLE
nr:hypothetical protein [uncultured Cohaesibacter sp.]